MPTTWKDERKNLGVDTDTEIAKRLGVSKERVRQVRSEMNIERAPRPLSRPERGVGTDDVLKSLNTVPLTAGDRQLLTDARVSRRWSQTELAKRIGSSLTFINAIEMGKKSPSPDYLNRLCKVLSLEWQCEFRIRIAAKASKRSQRSRR
jgi:transcriptional regulator with XRE-family HTH domain